MYFVIVNFADKDTERFFITGKSRGLPASIFGAAIRELDYLNRAKVLPDLQAPPGNHLESPERDRKGNTASGSMTSSVSYLPSVTAMTSDVEITDYH